MLILILIDVQYSQKAVEKFSNRQSHTPSSSHNLLKKSPPAVSGVPAHFLKSRFLNFYIFSHFLLF